MEYEKRDPLDTHKIYKANIFGFINLKDPFFENLCVELFH